MKKHILQLLICLWLVPFTGYSQGKLKVRIFNSNKEGVPYASIVIKGSSLGTISNANGDFELALPADKIQQHIAISCIGYKPQEFSIDSLLKVQKTCKSLQLTVQKQAYQLQEIVVSKQNILHDPYVIISKAIESLPNTLANTVHQYKAFYRQTHQTDKNISKLIETAITISDPGATSTTTGMKVNIDQFKTSLDNRKFDFKQMFNTYNYRRKKNKLDENSKITDLNIQDFLVHNSDSTYSCLLKYIQKSSMIRNYQLKKVKRGRFLNPNFIKEHRFKLDTILNYQDEAVYKIKILPNPKFNVHKGWGKSIIPIGKLYIRVKDYAIVQMEYAMVQNPKIKGQSIVNFMGRGLFHKTIIKYLDIEGRMYLSYLFTSQIDRTAFRVESWKTHKDFSYVSRELMITDVNTNTSQMQAKNPKWNFDLYKEHPYHPEFWKTYSSMLPTLEQEKLKKNLEQELQKK